MCSWCSCAWNIFYAFKEGILISFFVFILVGYNQTVSSVSSLMPHYETMCCFEQKKSEYIPLVLTIKTPKIIGFFAAICWRTRENIVVFSLLLLNFISFHSCAWFFSCSYRFERGVLLIFARFSHLCLKFDETKIRSIFFSVTLVCRFEISWFLFSKFWASIKLTLLWYQPQFGSIHDILFLPHLSCLF